MSDLTSFNPKNSLILYEIDDKLDFLIKLHTYKKLPKVLMLSGDKGIGKYTLINHFMNFIYDNQNYNFENKTISKDSIFSKHNLNNTFPNIIYLSGSNYKNIKIEDIRNLKANLLKTTILNKERFIILDDVELFSLNSMNALLKIIEEPSLMDYFILINSKTKPLIETIYSRSLELKVTLQNNTRIKIIEILIKNYNLDTLIDYKIINLSPGNFLSFNEILSGNKIDINGKFLLNLEKILNLYKKNKNIDFINLILFITEYYFSNLIKKNSKNIEQIIENKSFVIDNINNFVIYNLNQNSLINSINNKIFNE